LQGDPSDRDWFPFLAGLSTRPGGPSDNHYLGEPTALGLGAISTLLSVIVILPEGCDCASTQLPQYVFCKNATASKLGSIAHQLKKHVLAFLANGCQMPNVEHEFPAPKVYVRFFARTLQFCCPRPNELALYNQPEVSVALNDRDLRHGCFP